MYYIRLLILLVFCCFYLDAYAQSSSLYNPKNFKEITEDHRAFRVGDTVTIIVIESAQASASAGSADENQFGIGAQAGVNDKNWQYGLGINSNTEGAASTQRRGSIRAKITAVVTAIDKNKNLIIKGQQIIIIDGEEQKIELAGRARRSDISSNNTLVSNRLFDAKIKIIGSGSVTSGKEEGIISSFFKWLGIK